jgi:UDP-N-acetylmuramoylalanine--D-glutamate ligase
MKKSNRVAVCGLGASGCAAARLLRSKGLDVLALDERDGPEVRERAAALLELGCEAMLGGNPPLKGWFDAAVASPGLAPESPLLDALRRRKIPVVSELDLGWGHAEGRTLAVTGSNGKSSVVKALAECLAADGRRALACGNYGLPVCEAVAESPHADWLVAEVSSFQLETCVRFRPDVAVLLNVLPNHLDRHGTFDAYARLKARIFARQGKGDVALAPFAWRDRCRAESGGRGEWRTFGAEPEADYVYTPGRLAEKGGEAIDVAGSYFDNEVLGPNAAALYGAARAAGATAKRVREALMAFAPLPHRAQALGMLDGVVYVDDSKATNLAAMAASLRMRREPVWLIAGGRPKESDFASALPVLKERVRGVFLMGEASEAMAAAWGAAVECRCCGTMDAAVAAAHAVARAGEAVLLAPACTSYDQFGSYAERGDAFQKLVAEKGLILSGKDAHTAPK